uniref:Uncharacterized protein n=1 Tax=Cannabis sativa TaxID=3483 RepID=A0A803QCT7_CANSA
MLMILPERDAAVASAAQGTIPQSQPDPSVRRPQGRPRDSRTRRQENNKGNPINAQEEQPRNARDVPMERENPPNPREMLGLCLPDFLETHYLKPFQPSHSENQPQLRKLLYGETSDQQQTHHYASHALLADHLINGGNDNEEEGTFGSLASANKNSTAMKIDASGHHKSKLGDSFRGVTPALFATFPLQYEHNIMEQQSLKKAAINSTAVPIKIAAKTTTREGIKIVTSSPTESYLSAIYMPGVGHSEGYVATYPPETKSIVMPNLTNIFVYSQPAYPKISYSMITNTTDYDKNKKINHQIEFVKAT